MPVANELPINTGATAIQMAQEIFGSGVTVTSATYLGDPNASGTYSNGNAISGGVVPGDTGVILSTGNVTDFTNSDGSTNTNQNTNTGTNTAGIDNDAQFNALAGTGTNDAAILEIEFLSTGPTLTLDFVVASEEYPEWITSQYLDTVGVWVNGVEAQVSIGDGSASVGNINGATTPNLYNDNQTDQFNTEMDGFTITLTFVAPVNTTGTNTLRVGVADVLDSSYDTALLLAGGAVQATIVAQDDQISLGNNDTKILDVLDNDSSTGGALTVTHINGTAVVAGTTVALGTGQNITLNADGTFTVEGDSDAETVYFNYEIEDASGNTDTAIVEITQVPCFTTGTLIETPSGLRPVEDLRPGDLVNTVDNGPLPIRWAGGRTVAAEGNHRPIRLCAGAFGATADLILSPQHRVMIGHYWVELMFGTDEVLVKAKDLINDTNVRPAYDLAEVTYHHILFDTHQVVMANGVPCESYLPGQATASQFDHDTQDEIIGLFPELADGFENYGASARTILKTPEATALCGALAA